MTTNKRLALPDKGLEPSTLRLLSPKLRLPVASLRSLTLYPIEPIGLLGRDLKGTLAKQKVPLTRQPQDSNLRRHGPMDFKSIALTTRPGCLLWFCEIH